MLRKFTSELHIKLSFPSSPTAAPATNSHHRTPTHVNDHNFEMSEPTETEQTSESKGIELTAAESKFVLAVMANLTSDIQVCSAILPAVILPIPD